jgi:hypothetical protein
MPFRPLFADATQKLFQFQCQKEGSLFYYQSGMRSPANLLNHCPLCGSARVLPTGRTYPGVDEERPITRKRRIHG